MINPRPTSITEYKIGLAMIGKINGFFEEEKMINT